MKGCTTCEFAQWQRTPSGRINQRKAGKCNFPLPDLSAILPISARVGDLYKDSIWPDYGHDCPTWKQKEK